MKIGVVALELDRRELGTGPRDLEAGSGKFDERKLL